MIIQIYEIQTPEEAIALLRMGVQHIGSVALSTLNERDTMLYQTIRLVQKYGAKSSLIPLFSETDRIFQLIEDYSPDIIHFCENILVFEKIDSIISFQKEIKQKFPKIQIQRAIPIPPSGKGNVQKILQLAKELEEVSDYFLTDTVLEQNENSGLMNTQTVSGFVGITGQVCDWEIALALVQQSKIPVIVAGGLSPQNVKTAIEKIRPAGVDSCSATNRLDSAGMPIRFQKNMSKVAEFIKNVRSVEIGM